MVAIRWLSTRECWLMQWVILNVGPLTQIDSTFFISFRAVLLKFCSKLLGALAMLRLLGLLVVWEFISRIRSKGVFTNLLFCPKQILLEHLICYRSLRHSEVHHLQVSYYSFQGYSVWWRRLGADLRLVPVLFLNLFTVIDVMKLREKSFDDFEVSGQNLLIHVLDYFAIPRFFHRRLSKQKIRNTISLIYAFRFEKETLIKWVYYP